MKTISNKIRKPINLYDMKKVIAIALIAVASIMGAEKVQAQQLPQFTQYMFNNYIVNPAVAGVYNYYQVRTNNRFQWAGIPDAPQTFSLSAYGPHAKKDMGFGGYFYRDQTGPTSRTGGLFSYSYNMPINKEMRISGGLSLGFLIFGVDGSKLDLGDFSYGVIDPAMYRTSKSIFTPDASIGFQLYSSYYFAGISAHQLFGQKLYKSLLPRGGEFQDTIYGINKLKQHFTVSGGYMYMLNRDWDFEPSALIKYMFGAPVQVDLNIKANYRKKIWGGLSFRWQDGISILFGYNHEGKYIFGYSFDYSLTSIGKYNAGSHEIMLGYMFDKLK